MSQGTAANRPRQVTWGAGFAAFSAVLLVASVFDAMARLRSVDTRGELVKALDSSAVRDLGVSVDQATTILHGTLLVGGAAAAVAAVLAVYALLGNKGARVALSLLAVVVLICSAPVDPLLGLSLVFAVTLLWTRPARDWFAGRPVGDGGRTLTESHGDGPVDETAAGAPQPPQQPPPTYGYGQPQGAQPTSPLPQGGQPAHPGFPAQPSAQPPYPPSPTAAPGQYGQPGQYGGPYGAPYGGAPGYPPYPPASPSRTPVTVRTAAVLTWVFAGLTLIGVGLSAIALLVARSDLLDEVTRRPEYDNLNVTTDELTAVLWVGVAVIAFWALAACALAFLAWRGHNWARILLVVSAGVATLFCLASLPLSLAHLAASAAAAGLLLSPTANRFFKGSPEPPAAWTPPYPGPPGGGSAQPPHRDGDGKPPVW